MHEHAGDAARTHAQRLPGDIMLACEAAGVHIRDVDRESFKKAMAPVYDEFTSQFPKAEIETIMNAK